MAGIKQTLEAGYNKKRGLLFPYRNSISGVDIIEEILDDYNPEAALINTEARLSRLFDQYALDDTEKIFLANVAHMLWLEQRRPSEDSQILIELNRLRTRPIPFFPLPSVAFQAPVRIHWSLKNLTQEQIDEYLVGRTYSLTNTFSTADHHYHFKYYPIAQDVLRRLLEHHPDLHKNHKTAIARLAEFTADNFVHTNGQFKNRGAPIYSGGPWFYDGTDLDFSESFQRRLGGCGQASFAVTLLARSMNIPAKVTAPSYAKHRYVYFPTIQRWIHGDAISWGFGVLGEQLFWRPSDLTNDGTQDYREALNTMNRAKIALGQVHKVQVDQIKRMNRSTNQARSLTCGTPTLTCGKILSSDVRYFNSRFGYFQPVLAAPSRLHTWYIPDHRYRLLDQVAAWWPMDGELLALGKIRESSLRGVHGEVRPIGAISRSSQCVRNECLVFRGTGEVLIPNRPQLSRNDEELTIALWVKAPRRSRGTLFERQIQGQTKPVYSIRLLSDGRLDFEYPSTILRSSVALRADQWEHVAISFDASPQRGHVTFYINGKRDASTREDKMLPMARFRQPGSLPPILIYPAVNRMGNDGLQGALDEVLLYYGALDQDEVKSLFDSYQRN